MGKLSGQPQLSLRVPDGHRKNSLVQESDETQDIFACAWFSCVAHARVHVRMCCTSFANPPEPLPLNSFQN